MNKYPLISVIVPVYNTSNALAKCITSILKQSYQNFELLLIDDGSKDDSLAICEAYALKDERIRVFHQKNSGVSSSRNLGIQMAMGNYVCFVDSDDWIDEDYLETLNKNMHPKGLSVCQITMNDYRKDDDFLFNLTPAQAQISVLDCNGMQGFPVCKLFDLNLIRQNHIFFDKDIAICEDVLFCVQYLSHDISFISYSGKKPYHYFKSFQGATNSRFKYHVNLDRRFLSETDAIKKCKNFLLPSVNVHKACKMRYIKAAVNTLRTLEANRCQSGNLYSSLLSTIRKNCFDYAFSPYGVRSSKISVLVSAISPSLELKIWRLVN